MSVVDGTEGALDLAYQWNRIWSALPDGWGVGIQEIREQWEVGAAGAEQGCEWKKPYWTTGATPAIALSRLADALEARRVVRP